MPSVVVASFNVENLFARPKAFNTTDWNAGKPILAAYREFNTLIAKAEYSATDKRRMRDLLVELGVYYVNSHNAIRRRMTPTPQWAWLRKNRGSFDKEPKPPDKSMEIIATGRSDWIGWIELATEAVDEIGTRTTARVIRDIDADIIAVVEAEDRPSLIRLDNDLLHNQYDHVMLVDGNDERGIDVGIMTKGGFEIRSVRSHVDAKDSEGLVFSRDCPDYEVVTPDGEVIHLLINHFKSQSGGGGDKRERQARRVREIVDEHVRAGEHVIALGDFNEGPPDPNHPPENLAVLFEADGPLVSCYDLDDFEVGSRPGSFDSCGLRERLDYILLTKSLEPHFVRGEVFRKGLWGSRKTRPDQWATYPEMQASVHQASDHGALVVELEL